MCLDFSLSFGSSLVEDKFRAPKWNCLPDSQELHDLRSTETDSAQFTWKIASSRAEKFQLWNMGFISSLPMYYRCNTIVLISKDKVLLSTQWNFNKELWILITVYKNSSTTGFWPVLYRHLASKDLLNHFVFHLDLIFCIIGTEYLHRTVIVVLSLLLPSCRKASIFKYRW